MDLMIQSSVQETIEGGLVLEVEAKAVPKGAGTVVLVEPGQAAPAPTDDDIWAGTPGGAAIPAVKPTPAPEPRPQAIIPPLADLIGERGGLLMGKETPGAAKPRPSSLPGQAAPASMAAPPETTSRGWVPSGEKVVWNWPVIEDRLVEEFE